MILGLTMLAVLVVIAVTATATLCTSVVFVVGMVALAYLTTRVRHQDLVRQAQPVNPQTTPLIAAMVRDCSARLQVEPVQVFVVPSATLNAYTFGLSTPKVVVLYSALLQIMDEEELRFIVGHELGHVRLGHTWLNSLVGGMAGIPSPFMASAILSMAFRWWNRACEYSADRAGLLACGQPDKAVSALVRLATGTASRAPATLARAMQHVEAEDDYLTSHLGEMLATHPLIVKRIEELRRYAASDVYRRLRPNPGSDG